MHLNSDYCLEFLEPCIKYLYIMLHHTSRTTVCSTMIDVFNNITYVSTIKKPMKTKNKIRTENQTNARSSIIIMYL